VRRSLLAAVALGALLALPGAATGTAGTTRYLVVLAGEETADGFTAAGSPAALVAAAGGTIANDLSRQIGVVVAESPLAGFDEALRASPVVVDAGEEWRWHGLPDASQVSAFRGGPPGGGPAQTADPLEPLQWDMLQMRTPQAHDVEAGARSVDVGILDSGVDGRHPDFVVGPRGTNVDCARGRNSVSFLPGGPGVGTPDPCTDNQFHGTHVAGTVAAQANGLGVVGVAPNVTLVPVKTCDASGYCYASGVVDGITYAGDIRLDVINMSFFVDDDAFQESTEFKCSADPVQRSFRRAVERALRYARKRGVVPVAALGNSDQDLVHPVAEDGTPIDPECDVVPAETDGVIGVAALGAQSEKAGYSNYGDGPTDVAAPGGNGTTGDCTTTILSTLPGGGYGCIQGTSMASPHAAGLAALIVSRYGKLGSKGDVELAPGRVEQIMESTAVDIGRPGYDLCFGNGRVDALRAVRNETAAAYDATAPFCAEYTE
jgi:subtilisin family serine protease